MAKKGSTLVCVPCGREVLVTERGMTVTDLLCCGIAMEPEPKKKATAPKAVKKKTAGKKTAAKKKTAKKKTTKKRKK